MQDAYSNQIFPPLFGDVDNHEIAIVALYFGGCRRPRAGAGICLMGLAMPDLNLIKQAELLYAERVIVLSISSLHASPAEAGAYRSTARANPRWQRIAIALRNSEWRRNGSRLSPEKRGEIY